MADKKRKLQDIVAELLSRNKPVKLKPLRKSKSAESEADYERISKDKKQMIHLKLMLPVNQLRKSNLSNNWLIPHIKFYVCTLSTTGLNLIHG